MEKQKRKFKKSKARKVENSPKIPSGWNTTDEDEVRRRVLKAETEPMTVTNMNPENIYFSNFAVHSKGGQPYQVEIRSLSDRINSCSCPDYDVNGLGTCKHIEKVLLTLQKKKKRQYNAARLLGSHKAEIYVHPLDQQIQIAWPQEKIRDLESYRLLRDFFSANGHLISEPKTAIPVILRQVEKASENLRSSIRISERVQHFLMDFHDFTQKNNAKDLFLADVSEGKYSLDLTKLPLYEYQRLGMLHLAFMERALLADEMGLGKTVQAIAAAELLRRLKGIRKVLVVTPTSLKAEWEEQITKFISHSSLLIYGNRAERLRQYQQDSFFYLANYEQVVKDHEDILRLIGPDLIILDEAQRIKNWRTKTATTLKKLVSPYAFVLTGTPLENRIDDIYSIVQYLYPKLFGPLFRFNREFYELDAYGKPIKYKNLHLLHQRLKPILLRRLKKDVERELPSRTLNTHFVPMSSEQNSRYLDFEDMVARLAKIAEKRPLREDEFKRLQLGLASMRMLCDTPYILDPECRICPKLYELESILAELQEENVKIIIFSEWERMLMLVKELVKELNIGYAWHTGSVHQKARRGEIKRFKEDSACKVFLSTDCGALGLNLQAASVVINLDLPWNPAKLEQRIARAWRKHQTRTVQVINLVSENTIEHRMLGVLNLKQRLSDNVLDIGTIEEMDLPSGRKAFMAQLSQIIGPFSPQLPKGLDKKEDSLSEDPLILFQQEALARFKPRIHQIQAYQQENSAKKTLFAVIEGDLAHPKEQLHKIIAEVDSQENLTLEICDRKTFETIQRLCQAGVLSFQDKAQSLYNAVCPAPSQLEERQKHLKEAQALQEAVKRKERLTNLLIEGGFYEEALPPLREVFELTLKSLFTLRGWNKGKERISFNMIDEAWTMEKGLPKETVSLAKELQGNQGNQDAIRQMYTQVQRVTEFLENEISKFSLNQAA